MLLEAGRGHSHRGHGESTMSNVFTYFSQESGQVGWPQRDGRRSESTAMRLHKLNVEGPNARRQGGRPLLCFAFHVG